MQKQIENLMAQAVTAMLSDGITRPTAAQCKDYFLSRIEREQQLLSKLVYIESSNEMKTAIRSALAEGAYNDINEVCGVMLCETPATCDLRTSEVLA